MKKLLLAFALTFPCLLSLAQNQNAPHPNWGNFFVTKNTSKGAEQINVNYQISPSPVVNELSLFLDTPEPMILSAKLMNTNSELLMSWMPTQKDRRYNHSFDISNLAAGAYRLELYADGKKVQTLNFSKGNSTTPQITN